MSGSDVGDRAGDAFGAAADAVELDRLLVEHAGELAVDLAHGGDARSTPSRWPPRSRRRRAWMSWICAPISLGRLARSAARSAFTSLATTAKPRPAAPARAASMVALSASSEVCAAIALDQLDDGADPVRGGGQAAHGLVGAGEVVGGAVGGLLGGGDLVPRARDQREQLMCGARRRRPTSRGRGFGGVGGGRRCAGACPGCGRRRSAVVTRSPRRLVEGRGPAPRSSSGSAR